MKGRSVIASRFVGADSLIRNISGAALHAIIDAERADGAKGFVIKCGNTQSRAKFLVEFAQIGKLFGQGRKLGAVVGQQKFLVARIPQPRELTLQHDRRQDRHLELTIGVLAKFRARTVLLHADHAARASHGKPQGSQGVHSLLFKTLFDIPHGLHSVNNPPAAVKVWRAFHGRVLRVKWLEGKPMATKTQSLARNQAAASLTNEEILRYSRHLIMPEVGMEGQLKLKSARVLLIGTGGLGAPLGLYLTAAGVGHIGLVDFDIVDFTNLQRQVTFGTSDVGKYKSEAARNRLSNLNPDIQIESFETQLTSANALELFKDFDIIVDGTDNFPTRYLVNDACILLGKPNVYGSIFRFEGQATVFGMPDGPCYRCLYPEPPPPGLVPSCAEGGVLGVLPGIVGSIQSMETIK